MNVGYGGGIAVTMLMSALLMGIGLSCEHTSDPKVVPVSPSLTGQMLAARNIRWELAGGSMGDSAFVWTYPRPFWISFNDTQLVGHDGCNGFSGRIRTDERGVLIDGLGVELVACSNRPPLDAFLLCRRWSISLTDSTLQVFAADTMFLFTSRFTKSVAGLPFIGRRLTLRASSEELFASIRDQNLLPTMTMTSDRTFLIEWPRYPIDTTRRKNFSSGVFGVGEGQSIRFTSFGSYSDLRGDPINLNEARLIARLLSTSVFILSDSSVTFMNGESATYYRFQE